MRILLAGNNLAAVWTLDLLLEAAATDDVLAIAPRGAHHDWHMSLADHAAARGVACLTPEDVNDPGVVGTVAAHAPELLLSVYYTQIFRPELLAAVNGPALNFHPSLLPRHRGVAPLVWAIAEGDRYTGLTVHAIDEGIDTGSVLWQYRLPIHRDDTGYLLHLKMAKLVRGTAADVIRGAVAGQPLPEPQAQTGDASYHSSRDPALNHVDWSWPRERIRNVVRALAPPLPGAYAIFEGQQIPITAARPVEPPPGSASRPPGMVTVTASGQIWVWAAEGPLALEAGAQGLLHEGAVLQ